VVTLRLALAAGVSRSTFSCKTGATIYWHCRAQFPFTGNSEPGLTPHYGPHVKLGVKYLFRLEEGGASLVSVYDPSRENGLRSERKSPQ
jgi:hypothetical protein